MPARGGRGWRATPICSILQRFEGGVDAGPDLPLASRESDVSQRDRGPLLSPAQVLERYQAGPKTGVFTDGSCEGNPGPGGWGFVWVENDEIVREKSGRDPATTNNRMELTALIEALRTLPTDAEITVYSDSQLCVKTVNEWAAGWERRGWKRKTGPIANLELVQGFYALAKAHPRVRIEWIRSHDGSRWNEYADALASRYLLESDT
jgi:ribonuclease HI